MTSSSSLGSKTGRHEPGSRSSSDVAEDSLNSSQSATVEDDEDSSEEEDSSGEDGVSFKSSFERTKTNGRAVTDTVTVVMTMRKVRKWRIRWPEYGGLR